MTFAGVSTSLTNSDGSITQVTETDIVRLASPAAGQWHYDVFFQGANFGLSGGTEAIDAFTFTNTGAIIISTKGTSAVSTTYSGGVGSGPVISSFGEDLLRFTPSAPNAGSGIQGGTWALYFKGSKVGLSGASENVDAVSLVYTGSSLSKILLSTTGSAIVNGNITANPQDVLAFKPTTTTSLGANTAGTFNKFFVGSTYGLSNPSLNNVDALFFLPNASNAAKPSLFISTAGNFNVGGGAFTGNAADILRFNAAAGGPTGLLTGSFNSVSLRGSDFGHGASNVTGFYMGAVSTDPDPFGGIIVSPPSPFRASFASQLVGQSSTSGSAGIASFASTSAKTALAVSTSNSTAKVTSQQADHFFTKAKKQPTSSVKNLALSLLARFK